eukprot:scaffold10.g2432.t1
MRSGATRARAVLTLAWALAYWHSARAAAAASRPSRLPDPNQLVSPSALAATAARRAAASQQQLQQLLAPAARAAAAAGTASADLPRATARAAAAAAAARSPPPAPPAPAPEDAKAAAAAAAKPKPAPKPARRRGALPRLVRQPTLARLPVLDARLIPRPAAQPGVGRLVPWLPAPAPAPNPAGDYSTAEQLMGPLGLLGDLAAPGCPGGGSVVAAGARGDGASDDADALAAADAALPLLYLPAARAPGAPGAGLTARYRVGRSLTLTKPLVLARNVTFVLDAGVVLTITARPLLLPFGTSVKNGGPGAQADSRLCARVCVSALKGPFCNSAQGAVRFTDAVQEVFWQWWSGPGREDGDALQRAADACLSACTLMVTKGPGMDRTVFLNPQNGMFATNVGAWGKLGPLDAFVLRPGAYARRLDLPTVLGLRTAVVVQGGVSGARVFLPGVYTIPGGRTEAVVFTTLPQRYGAPVPGSPAARGLREGAAEGGAPAARRAAAAGTAAGRRRLQRGRAAPARRRLQQGGAISGVSVWHLGVTTDIAATVVFEAGSAAEVFQDVAVRGNFVLQNKDATVLIRGAPPQMQNVVVAIQAIDPNGRASNFVRNDASGAVAGLAAACETWTFNPGFVATAVQNQDVQDRNRISVTFLHYGPITAPPGYRHRFAVQA